MPSGGEKAERTYLGGVNGVTGEALTAVIVSDGPPMNAPRHQRRPARFLIPAILLAALVSGGWFWANTRSGSADSTWRTTPVERGDIRVAISATGTLSATSTVTVGSQISGQITDVLADFNDKVVKDQIIARIDPSTYQAQIEQGQAQIASARASLAQAEATLRNAELDFARKTELAAQKLVAQSDLDLARAALDQARAQVNSTKAQIRQQVASTQTTQVNLERTVIRSPVDGVVLLRSIEPGQTVAASMTAPELFQIAEDLSKMKIELAVDESDIGKVQPGQSVSFTADAFPERQFRGRVEQVRLAASTTNNVVTYPVVVSVDNRDGTLLPGLTVNAEIEVSHRQDVLKVSNAALRYKPTDETAAAPDAGAGFGGMGGGLLDDIPAIAAQLQLNTQQQSALDAALAKMRERRQAMRPQQRPAGAQGANMGPPPGAPPSAAMFMSQNQRRNAGNQQSNFRQRMQERLQQDFAGFTETLTEAQKAQWSQSLTSALSATRATVYRLNNGQREAVPVRIGASDSRSSEILGVLAQGDLIITGEPVRR